MPPCDVLRLWCLCIAIGARLQVECRAAYLARCPICCDRPHCNATAFTPRRAAPIGSDPEVERCHVNPWVNRGDCVSRLAKRQFSRLQGRRSGMTLALLRHGPAGGPRASRTKTQALRVVMLHRSVSGACGSGRSASLVFVNCDAVHGLTMGQPLPSRSKRGRGDAPRASPAPSGDVVSGGSTTGALSTLPREIALHCELLGPAHLSRLIQAANDADSAEPTFEFLPLALTH